MFLIVFVKKHYLKDISRVVSRTCAKGKDVLFTTVGNKGGISYSFAFKNRIFNIIGCHLQHKMEKQEKRNFMSRELVNEFKLQEIQNRMVGLESDNLGDYCFYLGDLNYRLKTCFDDLNNTNVDSEAISLIPTHDQLVEA